MVLNDINYNEVFIYFKTFNIVWLFVSILVQLSVIHKRVPKIIRKGREQAIRMNADKTVIINNLIDLLTGTKVRHII